jgi:hypothetical protein
MNDIQVIDNAFEEIEEMLPLLKKKVNEANIQPLAKVYNELKAEVEHQKDNLFEAKVAHQKGNQYSNSSSDNDGDSSGDDSSGDDSSGDDSSGDDSSGDDSSGDDSSGDDSSGDDSNHLTSITFSGCCVGKLPGMQGTTLHLNKNHWPYECVHLKFLPQLTAIWATDMDLKVLDVQFCDNVKSIILERVPNLEKVVVSGNSNLQKVVILCKPTEFCEFHMDKCPKFETYNCLN